MREYWIETANGRVAEPERWLPFLVNEFRQPGGFVVVGGRDGKSYVQARNDAGTLEMEYRDGSPQRHYQVRGVDLGDVAGLFAQWIAGERGYVDHYEWHRLTIWDDAADDEVDVS